MKKVLSVTMLLIMLCTFAGTALAGTKVSKNVQFNSSTKGGDVVFYVTTTSTIFSKSIKFQATKGQLTARNKAQGIWDPDGVATKTYASYEIIVEYKDSNGSWKVEYDKDMYNAATKTVPLKKSNTEYRITVHCWYPKTIFDSYLKNGILRKYNDLKTDFYPDKIDAVKWKIMPGCKVVELNNCTSFKYK
ncbi:MAG: hypothetical protein IJU28_04605 [Clostridia bacterium]|nr:hypothetical protein [Clostridia bacterium]